jgi:hypothetical protein
MEGDFVIDSVKYLTITLNGKKIKDGTKIINPGPGKSKIIMTYEKTH